ncbi:DNA circularization N-terminal domain-containing protein [Acetobacter sp. TBRC 12305]|uniref:DNA circularization N-terminal domain-containing protein n=1 Tax=Acetobacter garciniae TaxID=2817435 RepID=A0A939KQG7_9PROT|nr:DNA circularization N-terminal domain-containing protein [Acetobacter garciniae]MBO1325317.1 DNA circularization N-terminal domain-containing protein [Acetobacter garciniae]MBX0344711.1 DNA circularization N-terminal domain-containing protein [Acetobacter garciniae]
MSGALLNTALEYLQCSFRGVPFVVLGSGGENGRKQAIHRYAYRDGVWVEDMGKRERIYHIRGFVSGPTAAIQRDQLVNATETAGPGLLIHPTIGAIRAACVNFSWAEPDGITGRIDVTFDFIEQKDLLGTVVKLALDAAVAAAGVVVQELAGTSYSSTATSALAAGEPAVAAAQAVATTWGDLAYSAIRSPRVMASAIATLPGNNGRYAAGNSGSVDETSTVSSVLIALSAARAGVDAAITDLGTGTSTSAIADAVLQVPELLRTAVVDPGAQIAVLLPLVAFSVDSSSTLAPIGADISTAQSATAAMCRQMALASLSMACADWQPTSSQEAEALRMTMAGLLDTAATQAADAGLSDIWKALRDLRFQVTADLAARASQLPAQITIQRNAPLPALLLGQQLYADGSRADDLIRRADPIHPAFMPVSFEALSS